MNNNKFKAMLVEESSENVFSRKITQRSLSDLPQNDVLINVKYSSLNYKDALSANGHKGITRNYPHTPGIDAAGVVAESKSDLYKAGDEVIVTGYDLGMNTAGGFGQYISVPAEWIVRKPQDMTLKETMIYGTAGFTAGICIHELQKHDVTPDSGKVLVTGATGGVGCTAVAMLANAGYHVVASTRKSDSKEFLLNIGAKEVISSEEVHDESKRPLLKGQWMGAIDTVGGNTLATVIKSIKHRGSVCVLGLVESDKLETTVYPFLLRGIFLIGIDSAERTMDYRLNIWKRITQEWRIQNPEQLVRETDLEGLEPEIQKILKGGQIGRVLVNL